MATSSTSTVVCGRRRAWLNRFYVGSVRSSVLSLKAVTQEAGDLEIDLPRVYDYLAELLSETIRSGDDVAVVRCLVEIVEPIRAADSRKSGNVVVNMLKQLERRL